MLTLSSFDRDMNETIVKRGKDYFRKDHVRDLEEIDDGVWRALVEGSEVYDTTITIVDGAITKHRCSCPYDLGQFCKHEVAVLYAIRERTSADAESDERVEQLGAGKPSGKRRTVREHVEEAVGKLSEEELRCLVVAHALEDQALRRKVLRAAPPSDDVRPVEKKQEYIDIVRSCMEDNSDRHGFIGYYEAGPASEAAQELCEEGRRSLEAGRHAEALPIAQALLESIYPELGHMDDSNGEFGGCIEEGWNILRVVADKSPPTSSLGQEVFDYCLGEAGKKEYQGWSTDDDFLAIAGSLVHDDARKERLFRSIDRVLLNAVASDEDDGMSDGTSDWWREERAEAAARIKIGVFRALGKQDEASASIASSLAYPEIRELHLQELFSGKQFEQVKAVAKDGIAIAEKKGHPGTVHTFEEWLLKVAEAEGDLQTQRSFLRKFFLDHRHDSSDYEKLKKTYINDSEGWRVEYTKLAAVLKKQGAIDSLLQLYTTEERWDDFLACIRDECGKEHHWPGHGNIGFLERYEKILQERFPRELVTLYATAIPGELAGGATGRGHYQEVCRALRRMRKLGAEEIVEKIKDDLCKQYANRRALLDELSRV